MLRQCQKRQQLGDKDNSVSWAHKIVQIRRSHNDMIQRAAKQITLNHVLSSSFLYQFTSSYPSCLLHSSLVGSCKSQLNSATVSLSQGPRLTSCVLIWGLKLEVDTHSCVYIKVQKISLYSVYDVHQTWKHFVSISPSLHPITSLKLDTKA